MTDIDDSQRPKKREPAGSESDAKTELDGNVNNELESVESDGEQANHEADEHEDPVADAAVDDIVKSDSDDVLRAQDEAAEKAVVMKQTARERFKNFWARWWSTPKTRNSTIAVLVLIVGIIAAVPFTRYNLLGLVMKATVKVTVVDSKTNTPVSGASVKLDGVTAETDANGKAALKVHMGSRSLRVTKQYYQGTTQSKLVALSGNNFKAMMTALGHRVQVEVVNKISGKPVANAVVSVQGTTTKTAANGEATVVLASSATTQAASISGDGFNTTTATVTASGDLAKNTFSITPTGKLYFLSNLSGTIDVVKTNLDGSDRQTVLAGTGNEDRYSTSLLASRDWKYLALLSKRSGNNTSVYLIDTTNGDKLSTIDEGDANFNLIGWSGDRFVYKATRTAVQNWQANQVALKSFDPTTGHTLVLDQTQAVGNGPGWYGKQSFDYVYLIGDQVVYAKNWQGYGVAPVYVMQGKEAELDTIRADGSNQQTIKSFAPSSYPPYSNGYTSISIDTVLYDPSGLYVSFAHDNTTDFYKYEDGKLNADSELTADAFNSPYAATFLLSPSGTSTFWAEQRDGKNTLFTGDEDGKNQKQIASLSDYRNYGWFTDNYLLLSKNSSELYIMPVSGGTPLKITDYYKPFTDYQGYGGGYGGL